MAEEENKKIVQENVPLTFGLLPTEVKSIFYFFKNQYEPAEPGTATIRKTTIEITEELSEHSGTVLPISLVFKFLSDNGYAYSASGTDMQFTWLLKLRE